MKHEMRHELDPRFPGYVKVKSPDRNMIAKLTVKAKWERGFNQFSQESGISIISFSGLVYGGPTEEDLGDLIIKLAQHADPRSELTLDDFLRAYGMLPEAEAAQKEEVTRKAWDNIAKLEKLMAEKGGVPSDADIERLLAGDDENKKK